MNSTAHANKSDPVNVKDLFFLFLAILLGGLGGWVTTSVPRELVWVYAAAVLATACLTVSIVAVVGYERQRKQSEELRSSLAAAIQSFEKADTLMHQRLSILKQAVNYALKVEESDLLTAEEIRAQEARLPADSHVTILNPSHKIEIEEKFIEVVRENLLRGVTYDYLVRRDSGPLAQRLRKEFEQFANDPNLSSRIKIRTIPVGSEGELAHIFDVLCHYTMGVYYSTNSSSFVFLVAPGFDPQCAIRLPSDSSGVIVKSVEQYTRFLDERERNAAVQSKQQNQGRRNRR
jgi:hypothetical protein